jgi:adenylate cyclase
MERKLAAILAADVVGYSRLMGEDETDTLAALKAHLAELIEPAIAARRGRVVKLMGDGVLAEFASVVDAVDCAAEIQQAMPARNADAAEGRRIAFRIGINLGDVIVDGEDIHGDGVNVAARLEGLAEPGGIALSAAAYDQVEGKVEAAFVDAGQHSMKNIAKPVRVYRARLAATGTAPVAEDAHAATGKPSIAVLPFANMSADPDQEFFADGITEDIITALSRTRWYHVTARNSTFAYKGQSPDVREVARALGVRYVLEGSLRKSGQRVRITAQLIDAETGNHVWADRFDRGLDDELAVQDEIAHRVASILGEAVWQDIAQKIDRRRPETYGPYEYTFLGIELLHHLDPEAVARGKTLLSKALEMDPDLASAHLGLGFCYFMDWGFWEDPSGDALERAHQHALKTQAIAPDDAQTYRLLSRTLNAKGRFDEARRSAERALKINPNDGDIIANQGVFHLFNGEPREAIGWFDKVLELHSETPHTADIIRYWKALAHFAGRDYEAAVATLKTIGGLEFVKSQLLAACHARTGDGEAAGAMVDAVLRVRPRLRVSDLGLVRQFRRPEDRENLSGALREAGLPE